MEVTPGGALGRFLGCFWGALGILLDVLQHHWGPIGVQLVAFGHHWLPALPFWGVSVSALCYLLCFGALWGRLGYIFVYFGMSCDSRVWFGLVWCSIK